MRLLHLEPEILLFLSTQTDLKLVVPDPLLERGLELDVSVEGGDPLGHGVHVVGDLGIIPK